ncbi:MAG: acyltransferase family protein [Sciscionella sp.]
MGGNVRDEAATPPATAKHRIAFIDIGRSLAALLVFYSHIAEPWVRDKGVHAPAISFVDALTSVPMQMRTQGIGEIGVPFFFLVSGFIVTPIALKMGQRRFIVNRLCRVYPPMIFVVLLTALLLAAHLHPPSTGQSQLLTPWTALTNILTANYIIYPQIVLVPVAWTLIIEVLFYVVLVLMLPIFRRSVWLGLAVELTFVFVVLMSRSQLGTEYALFAVNVSYLPILIIGQAVWAGFSRKIPPWAAGLFLTASWALYVLADQFGMGRIDRAYNIALAAAVLLFLVGLFAEPRLVARRFWTALSERAYSLYLLHMTVSFVLLRLLQSHLPFWLSLLIAVAATFLVVECSYRLVERPSHRLGRTLSGHNAPPRPARHRQDGRPGDAQGGPDGSGHRMTGQIRNELSQRPR